MDSLDDLQEKWDHASRWYDFATAVLETLIIGRPRSELLELAIGSVLEVAAGTGSNLVHYPAGLDIFGVDLSPRMLLKARQRKALKSAAMDAESLAFRDDSFDTVVSTLGTCTFPDRSRRCVKCGACAAQAGPSCFLNTAAASGPALPRGKIVTLPGGQLI